jgi:tetratricopeptide (TPR) repeat protein
LLADEPWLPQAVAMLAQAYTTSGQTGNAIALLEEAATLEPAFYETLASAYEKESRWSDAARAYERAAADSPRDASLKTRWAFALLSLPGNSGAARARDLLLEVTKANPTEGWPLYLLAWAERETGNLDASEAAARRLMAIDPGSTSGLHSLAQVLEARRDWPGIIEALEPSAAKPAPARDTALVLTHLGFAYLEVGRGADAVAAFERASALDPTNAAARAYLPRALVAAKQYQRALDVVRAERQANPKDSGLARTEADALRGLGRFNEGTSILMTLAATDVSAAQHLAEYYAEAHSYAEAAAVLKMEIGKAEVDRRPVDTSVLFQYGAMLERQALHADAERVFRQVLVRDPDHAPTLNYLGYTLVERGGRLDEAVSLIKRAVAIDPHNGAYLDSLGWAYFKQNQLDLAEPNLRAAAGQLPRDSAVQDHWGDLLAKRGRYAEAVEAWRRALAGDGEQIERPAIERKISDALNKLGKR